MSNLVLDLYLYLFIFELNHDYFNLNSNFFGIYKFTYRKMRRN